MNFRVRKRIAFVAALALAGFFGVAVVRLAGPRSGDSGSEAVSDAVETIDAVGISAAALVSDDSDEARAAVVELLRRRFTRSIVRPDEAVLTFKTAADYHGFLGRAAASGALVLGKIDGLLAVRVRVGDYHAFVRELAEHTTGYAVVSANAILAVPTPPAELREARVSVPVGDDLLGVVGAAGEHAGWGDGVVIAVLDGGALPDTTFGTRLRYLDIGFGLTGLGEDTRHGTAVAAIAAGAAEDARGIAPAASVLSIRVTGPDGASDTFSVAQGLVAAVDAGAKIVNISLGGYATAAILGEAVDYALSAGVAVVAAAGNDQAAALAWPAAYPGVVSVGAVDGIGVQTLFSNSGPGLQLTAPGYGIQTAGQGGTRFLFSGTSASAPVVSGALAALMSQSPGVGAIQAADLLATYANEGGVVGEDPDYGRGTLNLGWAMERSDPVRVDPAISGQSFDANTGVVMIVVQNRGARPVAGLRLDVVLDSTTTTRALPELAAGGVVATTISIDRARLAAERKMTLQTHLVLPVGLIDRVPSNNRRAAVISASSATGSR